ncbi:hypothetical protein BH11PSE5_BH11PSE5_30710 [soil metagenome]
MDDIRTVRTRLGVTQMELAELLGLHQSTISRLEGGSLPVDARTKLALEALLVRDSRGDDETPFEAGPTAPAKSASCGKSGSDAAQERAA